ncbi:MAG: DUF86 domain-containing protein [Bacteroidales bacterium]|nr:DUF86 domain-containing protein [Bacteroidales bacterium]
MKERLNDKIRLLHIRDAILYIESFTKDFDEEKYLNNHLVQSGVERQLEIIGEAAANISKEVKTLYLDIEWNKIKAFRNVIAHEYFGVSSRQVWNVVCYELPSLKEKIDKIIQSF